MAAVRYYPQALIDPVTALPIIDLRGSLGTVVRKGTNTPLTLTNVSGGVITQPITASALGFTPTFDVQEGFEEAEFLSGTFRTPLFSGQGLKEAAENAQVAAELAQVAAEAALEGVDTAVLSDADIAAIVNNSGSATRGAVNALIATLAAQTASIEDLFVTPLLLASGGTLTSGAAASLPGFVAPFPLAITSISLVSWQSTSILASNTTYWTVRARILGGTTHRNVATKTTQVTDSTGAPGTEFGQRTPWNFNSGLFTAPQMVAGETMNFEFTPTGSVGTIHGPLLATIGYRPL